MDGKKERRSRGQILRNLMFVWLALAQCATQCECRAQKEDNPNRIKNFVTTSTTDKAQMMSFFDLSDVSMDNENGSKEKEIKKTKEESYNKYNAKKHSKDDKDKDNFCSMDGKSLKIGEIFERGCKERCACQPDGTWKCEPRCKGNSTSKSTSYEHLNSTCKSLATDDDCCVILQCDNEVEMLNSDNIARRLPGVNAVASSLETKQKVSVQDLIFPTMLPPMTTIKDESEVCTYKNKDYQLNEKIEDGCEMICHCREMGKVECMPRCPEIMKKSDRCVIVKDTEDSCCEKQLCDVSLDDHEESGFVPLNEEEKSLKKVECMFKGKSYKLNDQFHDDCNAFCFCDTDGVHCSKIECPSTFGLDVVDPTCVKWAPEPATFRAIAPKCCPERMKCVNNGSCEYKGRTFDNWSEIPSNISGCDLHCFCEEGKVDCRPNCPAVPALPPATLPCSPQYARLVSLDDEDDCCKTWACNETTEADKHKITKKPTGKPSKVPASFHHHENTQQQQQHHKEKDYIPFYPTKDGKLPILTEDKLYKIPGKDIQSNFEQKLPLLPPSLLPPSHQENDDKYNNLNHDQDEESFHLAHPPPPPLLPPNIHNINNINNSNNVPFDENHYIDKQLINILGTANSQFLPPHLRIEQLLQHIQQQDPNAIHGQHTNIPPFAPGGPGGGGGGAAGINYNQFDRLPEHFKRPAGIEFDHRQPDLQVIAIEAIDARRVRVIFVVPQIYVGLHGRVELRFTNKPDQNDTNLNSWQSQIFAPPEDLIATSQLEFELTSLEPNSEYRVKIALILRDLPANPSSLIYKVRTPAEHSITPPSINNYHTNHLPTSTNDVLENLTDPDLRANEINSTFIRFVWNRIADDAQQYIDGIQLRYKEISEKVYMATPLVHRTLTSYTLYNLQPETTYEFGLFIVPLNGAERRMGEQLQITTGQKINTYGFEVVVNVTKIKPTTVEVNWSGVPYPELKYINIYRAIYQSDSGKEDSSIFKLAKREQTTSTLIKNLKPGTRYRIWLEMYLTNGGVKKSNVASFLTKPGPLGATGKLETTDESGSGGGDGGGDYYGSLVVVGVVAALSVASTIILLLILTRRRAQSAVITPVRKNEAYGNPNFKDDSMQHETMNL